jgi:hypothetical protein
MFRDNAWCDKCQKYHMKGSAVFKKHKKYLGLSTGTSIRSLTRGKPIYKRKK